MKRAGSAGILAGFAGWLLLIVAGFAIEQIPWGRPHPHTAPESPIQQERTLLPPSSLPEPDPDILSAEATMVEWHASTSLEKTRLAEQMAAGARKLRPNVTGDALRRCVDLRRPTSERISTVATACASKVR
jgi:hypothetical protein